MSDINYLSIDDARELVERIAERTKNFNYSMSNPEKEAMSELLSEIGVKTRDLINVANLADNYAINAELVDPDEACQYDRGALRDALFYWDDEDGRHYCIQW